MLNKAIAKAALPSHETRHEGKYAITSVLMGDHWYPAIYINMGVETPPIFAAIAKMMQKITLTSEEVGDTARYTVRGNIEIALVDIDALTAVGIQSSQKENILGAQTKPFFMHTMATDMERHCTFQRLLKENEGWLLILSASESFMMIVTHPDNLVHGIRELDPTELSFPSDRVIN